MIRFLVITAIAWIPWISNAQQNIYSSENSYQFAKYMFEQGNCEIAAQDINRIGYFNALNSEELNLGLKASLCAENLSLARDIYNNSKASAKGDSSNTFLFGSILLLENSFNDFDLWVDSSKVPAQSLLLVSEAMLQEQWFRADSLLMNAPQTKQHLLFQRMMSDYHHIKFKKPFVAASLSTIIPGSGKFYTGEWKDGVFSMVLIGVISWQTTRMFQKNGTQSILAWTGAAIGTSLYVSNIYGAVRSAKNVNRRKINKVKDEVEDYLLGAGL